MTSYSALVSAVYDQTVKMLEYAQQNDWSELINLEQTRSAYLQGMASTVPDAGLQTEIEQKLKEIIEINKMITVLSQKEKRNCLSDFNQLKNGKKATSAYQNY